ncbi:MAG: Gfo/Idh/MocA family oxidoreductase [Chloroflexota bacterium]|jgi:predicted dehydrogenase|nr:Gfo/Idh/MocA family oxidoreductase [Chloroflexota bacterium]
MSHPIRVGVIGCGAIAQIQHLPNLAAVPEVFSIGGICDLSEQLLAHVGNKFHVPAARRFRDYRDLINSDIDAVIVCPSGTHAPQSIAAAQAGKHVLVEKPACVTVREAEEMVQAADSEGTVLQVAYMKRYDPGYVYAKRTVEGMTDVRFIQVNHLHPDNKLHLADFDYLVPTDFPASAARELGVSTDKLLREALGREVDAHVRGAFHALNGSMIHDIGNLHGIFGSPSRVVSTEIWAGGRAFSTVLEYENEVRAVATWVDLPELWHFRETLEVYGSRERVLVSFPSGFARGLATHVTVEQIEGEGLASARNLEWHEDAFTNELLHFGDCITGGTLPNTPGSELIEDVGLVRDIVLAYLD